MFLSKYEQELSSEFSKNGFIIRKTKKNKKALKELKNLILSRLKTLIKEKKVLKTTIY